MNSSVHNKVMQAMVLDAPREPVKLRRLPRPQPAANELLVKIAACAVCRTDLHVVDGELPDPKRPIIPGHEIVGRVAALGTNVENFVLGERVGNPLAGLDLREVPLLPQRPGKFMPRRALYGIPD